MDVHRLLCEYDVERSCNMLQVLLLKHISKDGDTADRDQKARGMLSRLLRGEDVYDSWGTPLGDGDHRDMRPVTSTDEEVGYRHYGPAQAETIPLEDDLRPFPGLDEPVNL